MFLKKRGLANEIPYNIVYDKVVDDLLLIEIHNDNDESIPSYWRLVQPIDIPPLEIGINCETGCISSVTCYIDLNCCIKNKRVNINASNVKVGNAIIDVGIFKQVNDCVDVGMEYYINIQGNKLICLFQLKFELNEVIKSGSFEVYINSNNEIIGFSICNANIDMLNIV